MNEALEKQLENIEKYIRTAKGEKARAVLEGILKKKVPLDALLKIAELARRSNMPEVGARLLHPIVRPSARLKREATIFDRVEYAACLIRLGAVREGNELLQSVDPDSAPESLLYKGMIHMKSWDFAAAIPLIRQYLSYASLDTYKRCEAHETLAFCLIFQNRLSEAKSVLGGVLEETAGEGFLLLQASALRLLGNLEVSRGQYDIAIGYFERAKDLLANYSSLDHFLCRKWIALSQHFIEPKSEKVFKVLDALRDEAVEYRHWESLRDIDYYMARFSKNNVLFQKLYFGTPFLAFRERLLAEWPSVTPEKTFIWHVGPGRGAGHYIDVIQGEAGHEGAVLKAGQTMHRLFCTLVSDFYRPFTIPELYETLFPGEYYSPGISEYRVHQTIKRLRAWLDSNQIPLFISEANGEYRLKPEKRCSILVKADKTVKPMEEMRIELVRERLGNEFSLKETLPLFNVTRRRASEVLQQAMKKGLLVKIGSGTKTRYRFVEEAEQDRKAA